MYCSKCGTKSLEGASFCQSCGGSLAQTFQPTQYGQPGPGYATSTNGFGSQFAGFWLRFGASIIDSLIMDVVVVILFIGLVLTSGGDFESGFDSPGLVFLIYLMFIIIEWLYYAVMESSTIQATVGKLACGIKVTDMEGNRISFGQASGRFFGKIISALIVMVGYMMAGFTEKKQALHDIMAGCLVVKKNKVSSLY
jgi:uncharacterized RDD family membrane protein YckC